MIHWFKRHPQYLVSESDSLRKNRDCYKELIQLRNNLFISHGNIVVRLDKIHRFPILIVYSEATPYVLPSIYLLKRELTNDEVEGLSKSSFDDVFITIHQDILYYYHLRHQNFNGCLCILEWDNLDDGSKFYGITTILKRVRDWFKGTITGDFPPDSQEVEFSAHFVNVNPELKFLYPEAFLNENIVEGEAFALLFSHRPKGKYYLFDQRIFFGCLLTGKNKGGLYESLNYELPIFFYEEGINNAIELFEQKQKLKRLTEQGTLLRSSWFQLQKEPAPFKTFKELINLIGDDNYEAGVQRMIPLLTDEQSDKPTSFFISIRFPNRKEEQEFQLFRVIKKSQATGVLIGASAEEAFNHFSDSYELVQVVKSERFSDESFHLRNAGRAERNILKDKTVNIIGVGALGSEIADSLGKAGVGKLELFDNQEIKAANPVRHLAGLDQVGLAKVAAVAKIISDHNPFVQIGVTTLNVNTVELIDFFKDDSIAVSSMAEDNTEGYLNERAVISNKTVYYARALRGAKAARIFRVIPGKDACFHCLELYRKEKKEIIIVPEDETLPTLKNECNNPIRPASAADLKLISALTSRILLDELQQGFGEKNHWIWSTEKLDSIDPFQMRSQFIEPHPKCFYCNHEKKSKAVVAPAILQFMQDLIAENPEVETGGVLAGYVDEASNIVITHASESGPNAIKLATKFEKDIEFCQKFLDDLFYKSNKHIIYVGEWHSHPNERNQPSGTDIKSLTQIAYQKEYLTDMPLMIIFSNTGEPSCTIHPAGKRFYYTDYVLSV